jgi:Flp pilus assembly protein TadD
MAGARRELEKKLKAVDAELRGRPQAIEPLFARAQLLDRLGRTDDARLGYVAVLQRDAAHFGALTDLGMLLYKAGMRNEALTCYTAAVGKHPDNPIGHANLAFMLLRGGDAAGARDHYEAALRLDPKHIEAHRGLALALAALGDGGAAQEHREAGFRAQPMVALPYRGAGRPVRVLLLVSASSGNTPVEGFLDDRVFATTKLVVEYDAPGLELPKHDLVFNAVADADICGPALDSVARVLTRTAAPVINAPDAIRMTGRAANARRLRALEGVIAPRIVEFARSNPGLRDFTFPMLVRSPGYHTGTNFEKVDRPEDLAATIERLPGDELLAIAYADLRGADGKVRKYRAMFVGGTIYPLHLAISTEWKVHYFSADMAEDAAHRAEDAAFLTDMPRAIGSAAMAALGRIAATLGLDYAGVDFGLESGGDVVVFEANATMIVPSVDEDERWAYRRAPVERIYQAVRAMLLERAGKGE